MAAFQGRVRNRLWPTALPKPQERMADSIGRDPHNREYYLQQIPKFTEEQLQASNDILRDALYQAGILEMERLEMVWTLCVPLAASYRNVPGRSRQRDNVYYHLIPLASTAD